MNNIFSDFFLKKDNKVVGPLRLEEIEQFLYDNFLDGSEMVSENSKDNWVSIKKILSGFDEIMDGFKLQAEEELFLSTINKDSEFKILTDYNLKMGPINVNTMIQMIDSNKISDNYKIILGNLTIPYRSVSQRFYRVISEAVEAFKNEDVDIDMDMDFDLDDDIEEPKAQKIEPKVIKAQKIEPKVTKAQKIEPKVVKAQKIEPKVVKAQKIEPKVVKAQKIEPKKKKEEKMDEMNSNDFENLKSIDLSSLNVESMQTNLKFKEKTLSEENEKGLLSSKPLMSLLFVYALEKLTGVLVIEKKNQKHNIFFQKGKIASVTSNLSELSIFTFLKNKNIEIPESEESDSMIIGKLIAMGKLEPSKGYELLKELVLFRLKEIFKFSNGRFVFKKNQKADLNLDINFLDNIWKMYIELIDIETIDKFISKIMNNIILKDELFYRKKMIRFAPLELKLVNKINNKLTTKDFLDALQKQKPEYLLRFKQVIFLLFNIRFVKTGNLKELRDIEADIANYKKRLSFIENDANLFQILELPTTATLKEIEEKYFFYAKEFHPDKLNKETNKKLKQLKSAIYTSISTAFNKLSTQKKLDDYINTLNYENSSNVDTELYFKAEDLFMSVRQALKIGKYAKAKELVVEVINLVDNEEYRIHEKYIDFILIWQKSKVKAIQIVKELEEIVKVIPNYAEGHRFLARCYKLLKDDVKSKKNWKEVLKLAPYDSEAKREL